MNYCPIDQCLYRFGNDTERLIEHLNARHGADMRHESSADALDALDDARDAVKLYETGLWWGVTAVAVGALLLVGGGIVRDVLPFLDTAGVTAMVVGGITAGLAALFGIAWTISEFVDRGGSYGRRRRAQRNYDRVLRREGEKAAGA